MALRSGLARTCALLCLSLLFASASLATGGLAQLPSKPNGRMAATAYGPLPEETTITIDFRDDTDLNNRLRTVFEGELKSRGYCKRR